MRKGSIHRKTKETDVFIKLNLDGKGINKILTPIKFFNHMLEQFSFHSGFDLEIKAKGDVEVDYHHLIEDIGITLGEVFLKSLKNAKGINRYGNFLLPMDEALSYITVDISGRPFFSYEVKFSPYSKTRFDYQLLEEFFRAFAFNARINLQIKLLSGKNNHHIAESIFKGFGIVLKQAVEIRGKRTPSTKGIL